MKRKKITSIVMALIMGLASVALLAGCNGDKKQDEQLSSALAELSKLKNELSSSSEENNDYTSQNNSKAESQSSAESSSKTSTSTTTNSDSQYASIYADNLKSYQTMIDTYKQKYDTLIGKLGDNYDSYISNVSALEEFYADLEEDYTTLFAETAEVTEKYTETIKSEISASDYNAWDDELDELYDSYYNSGVFDDFYDEFYSGMLDDIYDKYYCDVLNDKPDNIEYKDWYNTTSDFYKKWSNASSDLYKAWSNASSDFYKLWSNTSDDFYKGYYKS